MSDRAKEIQTKADSKNNGLSDEVSKMTSKMSVSEYKAALGGPKPPSAPDFLPKMDIGAGDKNASIAPPKMTDAPPSAAPINTNKAGGDALSGSAAHKDSGKLAAAGSTESGAAAKPNEQLKPPKPAGGEAHSVKIETPATAAPPAPETKPKAPASPHH